MRNASAAGIETRTVISNGNGSEMARTDSLNVVPHIANDGKTVSQNLIGSGTPTARVGGEANAGDELQVDRGHPAGRGKSQLA